MTQDHPDGLAVSANHSNAPAKVPRNAQPAEFSPDRKSPHSGHRSEVRPTKLYPQFSQSRSSSSGTGSAGEGCIARVNGIIRRRHTKSILRRINANVPDKSFQLLLLRHGQTDSNAGGILQGHLPVPLNAIGLRQAKQLAARIARWKPSVKKLVSSDLLRAARSVQGDRLGAEH